MYDMVSGIRSLTTSIEDENQIFAKGFVGTQVFLHGMQDNVSGVLGRICASFRTASNGSLLVRGGIGN